MDKLTLSLIVFTVFCVSSLRAQIVVDSTLLEKQDEYLLDLKNRRKELKESLKSVENNKRAFARALKKYVKKGDVQMAEEMLSKYVILEESFKSKFPVLGLNEIPNINKADIPAKYKKKYSAYQRRWESAKSDWSELTKYDSAVQAYIKDVKADSVMLHETEKRLSHLIGEELKKGELPISEGFDKAYLSELDKQFSLPDWQRNLPENLFETPKEMLGKVEERQLVDGLAGKADKVESAKSNLQLLKEKYSYVPNSEDLSTAIKNTSLERRTFSERLILGGTVQFLPGQEGLKVDLSPTLGYGINKKFTVGLGVSYRADFNVDKLGISPSRVYGAKAFSQHHLLKGFFLHAEYEYLMTRTEASETTPSFTQRTGGFLAGLAKEFSFLKKVNAQVQWLYHFDYDSSGAYQSPWVFRIGFINNSNR